MCDGSTCMYMACELDVVWVVRMGGCVMWGEGGGGGSVDVGIGMGKWNGGSGRRCVSMSREYVCV